MTRRLQIIEKESSWAHLACPCGNSLSNSCDGDETEYYFVENEVIEAIRMTSPSSSLSTTACQPKSGSAASAIG